MLIQGVPGLFSPPPFLPLRSNNPGCLQPVFAHLTQLALSTERRRESLRMGTFFSEPGWLCLTVTAVLGGTIFCKLKKNQGQVGRKVVCLAGLWGGACLLSLSLFWGLIDLTIALPRLYARVLGCCLTLTGLPWRVSIFVGPLQWPAASRHCTSYQLKLIIYCFNTRSRPTDFSDVISL